MNPNPTIINAAWKCAESISVNPHSNPDLAIKWEAEKIQLAINSVVEPLQKEKSQLRLDIAEIRRQHQQEWNEYKSDEDLIQERDSLKKENEELKELISRTPHAMEFQAQDRQISEFISERDSLRLLVRELVDELNKIAFYSETGCLQDSFDLIKVISKEILSHAAKHGFQPK